MEKIEFKDYPDTSTPIDATNLNKVQTNIENAFTEEPDVLSGSTEPTADIGKDGDIYILVEE